MPKAYFFRFLLLAAGAVGLAGCTVHEQETPALSGPSEFALSFGLTATPDTISHDGSSQSALALSAYDANGRPRAGVTFRLDMFVQGTAVDYGTLSGKMIVTGSDGVARAMYTAPPPLPAGSNLPACATVGALLPGGCINIVATPVGTNFVTEATQSVEIHLLPLGVVLPPAQTPTASFTVTPTSPEAASPAQFDASASCAGALNAAGACPSSAGNIVSYAWEFSDGGTASGRVVSHTFNLAQTFSVTLTVTNDRGRSASTTKQVSVGAGSAPTASFVYSPTPVVAGAEVFFDASGSRPGAGHRIAGYKWNWGDGETSGSSSSPLQDHDFFHPGTYAVTLTVTDEAGQDGTTTQTVTVTGGGPTADFSYVVSNPVTHTVAFDARTSTSLGGATITDFSWLFGDGTTGTGSTPTKSYVAANSYTVKLTITDSLGRTGVVSRTVLVP
jgi:PKD repeat protein